MKLTPDWLDQFNTGGVAQKATPASGDRVLIDDSAASFAKKYTFLSNLLGNTGVEFGFGASMGSGDVGKYFQPHGDANGGKFSSLDSESQLVSPVSGTIEALAWIAENSPITNAVLKVWKNGLVVKTITVSGSGPPSSGASTGLNVAVAVGDLLAVEYDAVGSGGDMKKTAIELFIRGV